jgi:hypothetical protein
MQQILPVITRMTQSLPKDRVAPSAIPGRQTPTLERDGVGGVCFEVVEEAGLCTEAEVLLVRFNVAVHTIGVMNGPYWTR